MQVLSQLVGPSQDPPFLASSRVPLPLLVRALHFERLNTAWQDTG